MRVRWPSQEDLDTEEQVILQETLSSSSCGDFDTY